VISHIRGTLSEKAGSEKAGGNIDHESALLVRQSFRSLLKNTRFVGCFGAYFRSLSGERPFLCVLNSVRTSIFL
jgi:hypothetical protein